MDINFYRCPECGQIIISVKKTGSRASCCEKQMVELVPDESHVSEELHIPIYEVKDGIVTVNVGLLPHPMTEDHYIEWVAIKTKYSEQIRYLSYGLQPKVTFTLCPGDLVEAVYAYCNQHALWQANLLQFF